MRASSGRAFCFGRNVLPQKAMPFSQVQGQTRAIEGLQAALAKGTVPHAWLFTGPEGVGKELSALSFAQALMCTTQPLVGCGACPGCVRVKKGNHPDVTWVMPEDEQVRRGLAGRSDFDKTPSRDIRTEQIRSLQERLAYRPLEGRWKVALVVNAHAMNLNAQNALLKTLEEPPKGTVLLLVTAAPDKLLPTIRSRCTKALFRPLETSVVAALVAAQTKLTVEQANQVAAFGGGSVSRALELDPKSMAERKDIIERFEALNRSDARGWLALAETLADDKATAEASLEVLQVWLRDIAVAQVGGEILNADLKELAVAGAQKVSPAGLARRAQVLEEARNAISQRNGAARLQLERLFIEMMTA
jgi:DNA polymerase III subunit delta'